MRTLHVGLRVTDLERSLAFYTALGYEVVGEVPGTGLGHLTMLELPGDEFVSIELVSGPAGPGVRPGTTLSHLVVAVDSMRTTVTGLTAAGVDVESPTSPDGSPGFLTAWVTDPDGIRIELVQWPAGHPAGMTSADFAG
ncbi:VOC family protein [Geodermatophilus amargosae]|uniref:VOC family protein n=1 Tax=Geodermatophilus amargosae TaxID=1296565 RepID=UPI0034DFB07C